MGVEIKNRRCSDNEACDGKGQYKLVLVVNPSRLVKTGVENCFGTNRHELNGFSDFNNAICNLNRIIGNWFEGFSIDDFKLSRIDITKDIQGIPENIIQEYIRIMRRMVMYNGFKLNSRLENNTVGFRCEDSFNALNESKGVEFVVYNKSRAALDQNYKADDIEFYRDTLRMELRCSRRFIRKNTKKEMTTSEILAFIYSKREKFMRGTFDSLFMYGTRACFLQKGRLKKAVSFIIKGKKRREKMLNLINVLSRSNKSVLSNALDRICSSDEAKSKLINYFEESGVSPLTISDTEIPFMQSISSMLEFEEVNENDSLYYGYMKKKSRVKKVFLHSAEGF